MLVWMAIQELLEKRLKLLRIEIFQQTIGM